MGDKIMKLGIILSNKAPGWRCRARNNQRREKEPLIFFLLVLGNHCLLQEEEPRGEVTV